MFKPLPPKGELRFNIHSYFKKSVEGFFDIDTAAGLFPQRFLLLCCPDNYRGIFF